MKHCEAENINFVECFAIEKHFFEQIFQKVEPESFLYEFLNSGDPLYAYGICDPSSLYWFQIFAVYAYVSHVSIENKTPVSYELPGVFGGKWSFLSSLSRCSAEHR